MSAATNNVDHAAAVPWGLHVAHGPSSPASSAGRVPHPEPPAAGDDPVLSEPSPRDSLSPQRGEGRGEGCNRSHVTFATQTLDSAPRLVLGLVQLAACFLLLGLGPSAHAFVITRTSSPVFHIDTSVTPTLQAMYVAYQINNNSGATYADLWVGADTFTGGSVTLGPTEDGAVHLGSLAPGQTKTAFFYLQAARATTAAQSHTVRIYPARPPAGELASQTFSMTVAETIQANANTV